jgi:thioredoxin 2
MNVSQGTEPDRIQVACPQCHGLARVPSGRLGEGPKCPRCKSRLMPDKPIDLDRASFSAHAERASTPILVDFWAQWCGPCKMMAPVLDRLAAQRAGSIQVGKVDTDAQPELAGRFNIRSIPTLILFRGGQELARQSGAMDSSALSRWVDSALLK